jgi:hypothetical protein
MIGNPEIDLGAFVDSVHNVIANECIQEIFFLNRFRSKLPHLIHALKGNAN